MSRLILFLIISTDLTFLLAEDLQCYQCNPVTLECHDTKADIVKCGSKLMSRCSRQVKKTDTDKSRALRKCIITDTSGNVNCPADYDCYNCNQDLCNANPVVTTEESNSGSNILEKINYLILIPVVLNKFDIF